MSPRRANQTPRTRSGRTVPSFVEKRVQGNRAVRARLLLLSQKHRDSTYFKSIADLRAVFQLRQTHSATLVFPYPLIQKTSCCDKKKAVRKWRHPSQTHTTPATPAPHTSRHHILSHLDYPCTTTMSRCATNSIPALPFAFQPPSPTSSRRRSR